MSKRKIPRDGQTANGSVSPDRCDFPDHRAERTHLWREAIRAHRAGEPGIPAREAIRDLAEELDLDL